MRVALINPPVEHRYVHGIDEPLNLEYLAAQIRDKHDVLIIDSFSNGISVKETIDLVIGLSVDIAGISTVFSSSYKTTKELCEGIKTANPGIRTILGGNTATFLADKLVKLPAIDFVVRREGDISFPALIEAIGQNTGWDVIKGISYYNGLFAVHNPEQPLVQDLDILPFPARDLLPNSAQYPKSILSARGCAYGCPYCSASAFWGNKFRMRSVENIIDEIRLLNSGKKLTFFSFADDCFTLIPKRAMEISGRIKELDLDATWSCTGRIETVSEGLMQALSSAGCKSMFFGIESGSDKILDKLGRRYSGEDVEKVYKLCIAHGVKPYFSFIVGLPFENWEDISATFELIQKLEGVENGVHMLTPFPGTPILTNPDKYEIEVLSHSIEELDINTRSFIKTKHLSPENIEEAFRKALGYSFKALRKTRAINRILSQSE